MLFDDNVKVARENIHGKFLLDAIYDSKKGNRQYP